MGRNYKPKKKSISAAKDSSNEEKRAPEELADKLAVEDEVKLPAVKLPEVKLPEVKLPEVKLPEVKLPAKKRGRPAKKAAHKRDDFESSDGEQRTSTRGRQTIRVSYVDEIVIDDDEDDSSDESDWEDNFKGRKRGKGKKGKKGRHSNEERVYIPKPTKRTAKILSEAQKSDNKENGYRSSAESGPQKQKKRGRRT